MDILFAEVPYVETVQKEIKNDLIIVEEPKMFVTVPSIECILGDKLAAFSPHTTGIPLGVGKALEISKEDVLWDTIHTCLNIISRGNLDSLDYAEYIKGIKSVDTHILAMSYSGEVAMCQACQIMYFATCMFYIHSPLQSSCYPPCCFHYLSTSISLF